MNTYKYSIRQDVIICPLEFQSPWEEEERRDKLSIIKGLIPQLLMA